MFLYLNLVDDALNHARIHQFHGSLRILAADLLGNFGCVEIRQVPVEQDTVAGNLQQACQGMSPPTASLRSAVANDGLFITRWRNPVLALAPRMRFRSQIG